LTDQITAPLKRQQAPRITPITCTISTAIDGFADQVLAGDHVLRTGGLTVVEAEPVTQGDA